MNKFYLILAILTLLGCKDNTKPDEPVQYLNEYWGNVTSLTFVRAGKNSAYFNVVTDKYVFSELDITEFPEGKVIVGDAIFRQTKLSSSSAEINMCKNNTCVSHSICYSLMPCFNKYEGE